MFADWFSQLFGLIFLQMANRMLISLAISALIRAPKSTNVKSLKHFNKCQSSYVLNIDSIFLFINIL